MPRENLDLLQQMLLGEAVDDVDLPILLGDDKTILAANRAACDLFGYERAELVGLKPTELLRLDQGEIERLWATFLEQRVLAGTVRAVQRHGADLPLAFRARLVTVVSSPAYLVFTRPAPGEARSEPIVFADVNV